MHLPEGQRFTCSRCGRCCRTDWNVRIDRPEGLQPELLRRAPDGSLLARRQEGACAFLAAEGCSIHLQHGVAHKPSGCRLFPFILQPTPDGLVVGLSFLCPAVQANEGEPVHAHAAELHELADRLDLAPVGDRPLEVIDGVTLGWTGYRLLEQELQARLAVGCPATVLEGAAEALRAWTADPRGALDLADPAPAGDSLVRRYVRNLVHRKFLALGGPLLPRLEWLAREARRLLDSPDPAADLVALEWEVTHGGQRSGPRGPGSFARVRA